MKRTISIFLSALMLCSIMTLPAFATNSSNSSLNTEAQNLIVKSLGEAALDAELTELVANDMVLLEKAGLKAFVNNVQLNKDGTTTYSYPIEPGFISYINVTESTDGDLIVDIREGNIHNKLVYASNGKVFLDGHEVSFISGQVATTAAVAPEMEYGTNAGVMTDIFAINPTLNGTRTRIVLPSGFSEGLTNYKYGGISLGGQLASTGFSTFVSLIQAKYAKALVTLIKDIDELTMKAVLNEALSLRQAELTTFKNTYPNATSLSFIANIHPKNGNNSLYSEFIYEFRIFANTNYSGIPLCAAAKKIITAT